MKFSLICLFFTIQAILLFSLANKIEKIPMKTYPVVNIPDGELLRYGNYIRGEKNSDTYYVTRLITNENGVLYRIYANSNYTADYTNWISYYLIDPKQGTVLESCEHLSTNQEYMRENAKYGIVNTFFIHYILHRDKKYVEYTEKSLKENGVSESRYKVDINPGFPSWDGGAFFMLSPRFMDVKSGGIFYLVGPAFFKEPVPVTLKYEAKASIGTKAGTFRVKKMATVIADPFIGKLMEPFTKEGSTWVEDSDRRLLIKIHRSDENETFLEEISNILK